MKLQIKFFVFFLFFLTVSKLYSQARGDDNSIMSFLPDRSLFFAKDIAIKDSSNQKQRQVAICSAYNGWLYAAYVSSYSTKATIIIMKSTDNGNTWIKIAGGLPIPYDNVTSMDIAVLGDSISNLKLFLGFVGMVGSSQYGEVNLLQYNGETGIYENGLLGDWLSNGIALASDEMYPASNSNPRSIGVIYTKISPSGDSLIFCSSSNGGMSLDNRKAFHVSGPGKHFRKVALSYGRSFSKNSGRYYAAWEEKADWSSNTGQIWTAHTEPNFNSLFTTPVRLDSLDTIANNNARNPVIACQHNNIDNDSSDLTEIVLFEKYLPATNKYDIDGFYNMKSTNSNHFNQFILDSSTDNKQEPSVNFNPFDSKFMVTYFDSTTQRLPFLLNNLNMMSPNSWQIVSSGYNDSPDIATPSPKITLNIRKQQGAMVWVREGNVDKGVAMFDAPYLPTGIKDYENSNSSIRFRVYPNPCSTLINAAFEIKSSESLTGTIYNLIGKPVGIVTNQLYSAGRHVISYNTANLPQGSYLITFRTETAIATYKLLIIK